MTNAELSKVYEGLVELSKSDATLPGVVNYARKVNLQLITPYIQTYQATKDEILIKYGTSEDGYNYSLTKEALTPYTQEIKELDNQEVNIDLVRISVDALNRLDLTPATYDTLFAFVE